ncbi:TPA: RusA family crossover junction endodeoxyribonuclease [Listeria monocytogenes]|nr:RusA family crossover junction endodeoxyribonuclease [Listeria monocytogenes]HBI2193206.1 RusA family crossover junction endodeoxyribonuclease [Listeria monocytogenes]
MNCIGTSEEDYNTVRQQKKKAAHFVIDGKPQGKARARTFYNPKLGRVQSMTPENTVLYENLVKQSFVQQADKNARWFDKEPLAVYITAFYPIPASTTKKDRQLICSGKLYPTKKPDADNVAKVICDALNGVAYGDDTQIIKLSILKAYTEEQPRVQVCIEEIKEG